MARCILLFSIVGVVGYLATATALTLLDSWWWSIVAAFMVAVWVGFGVYLVRLVHEERRRLRVRQLRRRMAMPQMLSYGRFECDRS